MKRNNIIAGFNQLSALMRSLGENKAWRDFSVGVTEDEYLALNELIKKQKQFNGWFTENNVRMALKALGDQFTEENIFKWLDEYSFTENPKRVGIIMAGNIPLVGFHDFACVLLSGNVAVCKLSSDDNTLLPELIKYLSNFISGIENRITLTKGKIGEIEAVIATGNDNSAIYFEQYFGKYPHVFRSNRTSVAVLKGDETKEELEKLGEDVFQYFGLGCRNVSHILVPENFKIDRLFEGFYSYGDIINHHKYANNYDYNRAVFMLNKIQFLDNNFVILRESFDLFSSLAVVHYHYYKNEQELNEYLLKWHDKIQVVVGKDYLPFGKAQQPQLNDYADGFDTMKFLNSL